jgi:hypothetical protein
MKSGQLKITPGLTLQIYYGQRVYDCSLKVEGATAVYMPWATSKSTGLPEVPWLQIILDYEFLEHIKRTL